MADEAIPTNTVRTRINGLLNEPLRLLDDGILTASKAGSDYMVYLVPTKAVKKPYGLRELKNQSYDFEVPKNHVIARTVDKLADAGSVTIMRLLPASSAEMQTLHDGFVERGYKVKPIAVKRGKLTLQHLIEDNGGDPSAFETVLDVNSRG